MGDGASDINIGLWYSNTCIDFRGSESTSIFSSGDKTCKTAYHSLFDGSSSTLNGMFYMGSTSYPHRFDIITMLMILLCIELIERFQIKLI